MNIEAVINEFIAQEASDLFLTYGYPPAMRIDNNIVRFGDTPLSDADIAICMELLLDDEQQDDFESTLELNISKVWKDNQARLRINVFRQQLHNAFAIRRISGKIPDLDALELPSTYKDLIMQKRGLILVVGQTGCGKSSSLAAMVGHRNEHGHGHIITIEDPIEYVHQHKNCIISQRDIGIDTYSFGMALKNALRQTPDVILIGEIRDREIMEHAISFAETGHLCVSTLHSNNANQAIERILNFFPIESHNQVLANLSFNLRGIISQRLVENTRGTRSAIVEIMLNEGLIRDHIHNGEITKIKDVMEQNAHRGMQTFDQHIFELWQKGIITEEIALREADSASNLRLKIKQSENEDKFSASTPNAIAAPPSGVPASNFGQSDF